MAKLLFIFFSLLQLASSSQEVFQRKLILMGCKFDITVVANDTLSANNYIEIAITEIQRIEKLISEWDSYSQTSEIIRNAGIKPVIVDKELFDLIKRSIAISKLTDGAFDISYASMDKVWKFDGSMKKMPTEDEIKVAVSKVGYQNILLNEEDYSVFFKIRRNENRFWSHRKRLFSR